MSNPGTCKVCGCTEDTACRQTGDAPCHWVDETRALCSACVPIRHEESLTSVALDGARISAFLAVAAIESDESLSEEKRVELLIAMAEAQGAMNYARSRMPVVSTSVHSVSEPLIVAAS